MIRNWLRFAAIAVLSAALFAAPAKAQETYTAEEIFAAAAGFFGETTEGLASVIEKVFADRGQPTAFIAGEEVSGAFFFGLRYGQGMLNRKSQGPRQIYWTGPSIGWDVGGNASKVFTLIYNLKADEDLFQRFPGVDGSFYFVAGVGMNYQQRGDIILAPIRTGVGLRAGANVGYLHYGTEKGWLPF